MSTKTVVVERRTEQTSLTESSRQDIDLPIPSPEWRFVRRVLCRAQNRNPAAEFRDQIQLSRRYFDTAAALSFGAAFFTYLSIQLIISASVWSTDSRPI